MTKENTLNRNGNRHGRRVVQLFTVFFLLSMMFSGAQTGQNIPGVAAQVTTQSGVTTRVSVASNGTEGNGTSDEAVISADGRYVAFTSESTNLVSGDTNDADDIFVHDRLTGETTIVSVSSGGTQGNQRGEYPSISADGRYVAFDSFSDNLVSYDTNYAYDVFVHDRLTGETTIVSVTSGGTQGNSWSLDPSISADGRYVAFESLATNFVSTDTNDTRDIFVHDRLTGETTIVSVSSDGTQGNYASRYPSISADGRYVAFSSPASTLVSTDTNDTTDVFVHDRLTGETTIVSVSSDGTQGSDASGRPSISVDGRYVAFFSLADDLVSNDTNDTRDVFVHDRLTGETIAVSVSSDGAQGDGMSDRPSISADGRYVTFESRASNLVSNDTNNYIDNVFVHDQLTGETTIVSVASDGSRGDSDSLMSAISADGRYVTFRSRASNLVSNDTNDTWDIFVHDRGTGSASLTISGQVVDGSSNPLSGVTITTNSGEYATTDGSGNYTITGLITGTYTFTPTRTATVFTPPARTVSVPPNAGNQDFVGQTIDLALTIQAVSANTLTRMDQVSAEAYDIAQDGDYFAVEYATSKTGIVIDAIVDSAGVLAEGCDGVAKMGRLTKMELPGVVGRKWGHVLQLKAENEAARDAFRNALNMPVSGANANLVAKELFNGAYVYYAADIKDQFAEDFLTDPAIKFALRFFPQSDLALQDDYHPAMQKLVDIYKLDVTSTRDDTVASLPTLTPEEELLYIEDLVQRDKANVLMTSQLGWHAFPLHQARDDRENGQGSWIAGFLAKYLIKGVAYLKADVRGALAVETGYLLADLYQNLQLMEEDTQMMALAVGGTGGAFNTERRIYLNTVHGFDNITLGIEPHIAGGYITSVANKSYGVYILFGQWGWFERASHSEVSLSNPTPYDTTYLVTSRYENTGLIRDTNFQLLTEEAAKEISGGGADVIRIDYKDEWLKGVSPDRWSTVDLYLLGSTDTGTYYVVNESIVWDPERIPITLGGQQMTSQALEDAPTLPYPVYGDVAVDEAALTYTPHVWVDNPFTETVAITLTQPLLSDAQIVDAGGGSLTESALQWSTTISPEATVLFTHVIRYLGDSGQVVQYPEAQLEMADLYATKYATFTSDVSSFVSELPLSAEGTPPTEISLGASVTIPFTVTNRSESAAQGTLNLSLVDFMSETEVYGNSQSVTVPGGSSQIANLVLDVANIPGGTYLLIAEIESNGGEEEIFASYLRVTGQIYLPLVLRNH